MRTFDDHSGPLRTLDEKHFQEFRSPFRAVLFVIGCALLGFLLPTCAVLCFTNWLDPIFRLFH